MTQSPKSARRVRDKDACPGQLTAAARQLFLEKGFAATRMDDVAARAGTSKGTIYLYFATKEDLFVAVVEDGIAPILVQAESTAASFHGSSRELLSALMRGLLLEFWNSPNSAIPKLIIAEAHHFPDLARDYLHKLATRSRAILEQILQHGIDSGEFRSFDVPYVARVIGSAVDYQSIWRESVGKFDSVPLDPERFVDAILDLSMHGMLAATHVDSKFVNQPKASR